ncbi:MAG TPA: chloride channel protein [Gemmatimonadaceae bacterium]|jgi:H+/Cl- antiporter ClcA|nr:chloride channel protein [Gemmatimonadaceae bacterium]
MSTTAEHAVLLAANGPREYEPIERRTLFIAACTIVLGGCAGLAAQFLTRLIGLVTNVAFYGRISTAFLSPALTHRGPLALLLIPVLGALGVGLMARYGTAAIRGHGIPEVMERVLFAESRISPRVLILKPLSAALAIGTGGPFGAEGPIIATGGALGSLAGQFLHVTADERKTLLAAGAAAGMAATFGSPVSAVLLAVELLLFEYRPRSLIPVSLAAVVATGVRVAFEGTAPVFAISALSQPSGAALATYALVGLVIGAIAAWITRICYRIEDVFEHVGEKLGVHWMWWPIAGAVVVGIVGLFEPRTLGVGYSNITGAIDGTIAGRALIVLVILKFVSWSIYLGSGTSGGTLAPLFTIGAGLGAWAGAHLARIAPSLGVDARIAGLVGMAAIFAGASHALLTAVVFAFETTRQPVGLLPLLAGCTAAYLASLLLSRHSIMTEKLARRGVRIHSEYSVDHLSHVFVRDVAAADVVTLEGAKTLADVRAWLASGAGGTTHQGFPVLDSAGLLIGVVTRRDILDATHADERTIAEILRRPPIVVYEDSSLRDAADQMVLARVGRLPVVRRSAPRELVGILSRSDLLAAHAPRLEAALRMRTVRKLTFAAPSD